MADTLQTLQAQLPALQKKMQDAAAALTAAQADVEKWRKLATDCDAARAEFSLGWKKEKACSMASRGTYYANWDKAGATLTTATNNYTAAKNAVDSLNTQIDNVNTQNQNALLSDPNFALAANQQNANSQQQQQATTEAEKTKRLLWTLGIITAGIAVISGAIALIVHFKGKSA